MAAASTDAGVATREENVLSDVLLDDMDDDTLDQMARFFVLDLMVSGNYKNLLCLTKDDTEFAETPLKFSVQRFSRYLMTVFGIGLKYKKIIDYLDECQEYFERVPSEHRDWSRWEYMVLPDGFETPDTAHTVISDALRLMNDAFKRDDTALKRVLFRNGKKHANVVDFASLVCICNELASDLLIDDETDVDLFVADANERFYTEFDTQRVVTALKHVPFVKIAKKGDNINLTVTRHVLYSPDSVYAVWLRSVFRRNDRIVSLFAR